MNINWLQVLIAFFIGVFTSATVKGVISSVKGRVGG